MDNQSILKLQQLHPALRDVAIQAYNEAVQVTPANVHPVIDQTGRSFEESAKLYAQGRTEPGEIVTNAKPGESFHDYFLALDFHLIVDGKDIWDVNQDWMTVVNIFKKHNFEWGGDWKSLKDYPHLQMTFGFTWQQLLTKYNDKDFITGTEYLNLSK